MFVRNEVVADVVVDESGIKYTVDSVVKSEIKLSGLDDTTIL